MRLFFTPILVCIGFWVAAQQAPQYSMFMLNPYAYNPAYAGLESSLVLTGVYRKQWTDLLGAPETQHLNGHLPIYAIRSGVGLALDNDAIGAHRTTRVLATYAYHFEVGKSRVFSAGVSGGYLQYNLDGTKLRAPEGTYEQLPGATFNHNDPNLPEGKVQAGTPFFEAGMYFQGRHLQAGLSVQPLFSPALEVSGQGDLLLQPKSHYLASVFWHWKLSKLLSVKPGFLAKSDLVETQGEFSAIFQWRDNIMTGASFRGIGNKSRDAIVLFAGFKINERTTAGYSFDLSLSPLRTVNRGSHEILLRYNLDKPIGKGKLPPVIYNPRFF